MNPRTPSLLGRTGLACALVTAMLLPAAAAQAEEPAAPAAPATALSGADPSAAPEEPGAHPGAPAQGDPAQDPVPQDPVLQDPAQDDAARLALPAPEEPLAHETAGPIAGESAAEPVAEPVAEPLAEPTAAEPATPAEADGDREAPSHDGDPSSPPLETRSAPKLPQTTLVAAALPKRTLTGTVTDANGLPLAGAEVRVDSAVGEHRATTAPDGSFSIPDLPVGNYAYYVEHPERVGAWGTATLTPQGSARLDVALPLYSTVSGRITDVNGQGIENALVQLLYPNGGGHSTHTAADGTYAFTEIAPGSGTIRVSGPHGSEFATVWWSGASAGSAATALEFPPTGVTLNGIDAELRTAAIAVGYVLLPGDSPVPGARVEVFDDEGSLVYGGSTDASGRFATTGLPLGEYTVHASWWDDAAQLDLLSQPRSFTMSGQQFNLQPLVLDGVAEPAPVLRFTAADDSYSTPQNTLLQVGAPGVLANDDLNGLLQDDPDEPFFVDGIVTATAHGEVLLAADGSFVYQPEDGFTGVDSFTYRLIDPAAGVLLSQNAPGLTATATIRVGASSGGSDGNSSGDSGASGNASGSDSGSGADGSANGSGSNGSGSSGTGSAGTGSSDHAGGADATGLQQAASGATIPSTLTSTGFDDRALIWVLGIAGFLLVDGAVLLLVIRHRRSRAAQALAGVELVSNEGERP